MTTQTQIAAKVTGMNDKMLMEVFEGIMAINTLEAATVRGVLLDEIEARFGEERADAIYAEAWNKANAKHAT